MTLINHVSACESKQFTVVESVNENLKRSSGNSKKGDIKFQIYSPSRILKQK